MGPIILAVDNEGRFNEQVRQWLRRNWLHSEDPPLVLCVSSVEEAIGAIFAHADSVRVVISDIILSRIPGSQTNGSGLYWIVRERLPHARFFFVSSDPNFYAFQHAHMEEVPSHDEGGPRILDPLSSEWRTQHWLFESLT